MKYVRSGDKIIASLERGEELCGTLKTLAAKEDIKFALVRAHGSCVRVTLGSYDKKSGGLSVWSYNDAWDYELASVTGELLGGETPELNLHAVIGSVLKYDEYGSSFYDRNPGLTYAGTLESAEAGAGITAVLELLDIDARLADVPRPERVGLLDRISAALTDTDMDSPSYKRLELE